MSASSPEFEVRLAQTTTDLHAAQHLRYQVFVQELGADGPMVDHTRQREVDQFDEHFDHLLLIDASEPENAGVVGVYRLLTSAQMPKIGRYYSEDEYDLTALKTSGRKLLELGRSCVAQGYRGGTAMFHLWNGLADYVVSNEIEILFGVASFHGTDVAALAQPLAFLHHRHLAPKALRVKANAGTYQNMDLVAPSDLDRKRAMIETPALIKAYLRLGGFVGDGAFVDHAFNTTDVCLIMDTTKMSQKHRDIYESQRRA